MSDPKKKLEELHEVVAESLKEAVQLMKGMEPKDRNAALYTAAISLIKNSGIKADIEEGNAAQIIEGLPFGQPEEEREQSYG